MDFQGVAIFFVISGFIMCHITLRDDKESTFTSFFTHRIVRIVPLYWFCIAALIVFSNLGLLNLPVPLPSLHNSLLHNPFEILVWAARLFSLRWTTPECVIKSLFFIPYVNQNGDPHPILGVGWTLNMEIVFYLLFAISLRARKSIAPILVSTLVITIHLLSLKIAGPGDGLKLFASQYMVQFVFGIIVFFVWRFLASKTFLMQNNKTLLGAVASLTILLFFVYQLFPLAHFVQTNPNVWLIAPSLLVLSLLILENTIFRVQNKFVLLIGNAS